MPTKVLKMEMMILKVMIIVVAKIAKHYDFVGDDGLFMMHTQVMGGFA